MAGPHDATLTRWKAANYTQLYGMTLDEGIRYRLGTQRPSKTTMNMNEMQVMPESQRLLCPSRRRILFCLPKWGPEIKTFRALILLAGRYAAPVHYIRPLTNSVLSRRTAAFRVSRCSPRYVHEVMIKIRLSLSQMNMDPEGDVVPASFNSADKWPGKIHEPLDQGNCAASWAFSTAGRLQQDGYFFFVFVSLLSLRKEAETSNYCLSFFSRGVRPNLHPVHGSHDASAVSAEPHFLRHQEPGRLRRGPRGRGLVVSPPQRVSAEPRPSK